jgi:hypothetical protein
MYLVSPIAPLDALAVAALVALATFFGGSIFFNEGGLLISRNRGPSPPGGQDQTGREKHPVLQPPHGPPEHFWNAPLALARSPPVGCARGGPRKMARVTHPHAESI